MLSCKNINMSRRRSRTLIAALLIVLTAFVPTIFPAASDAILPEGTRITLQLNDHLSTKTNSDGDSFKAIVTNPVYLGDRMVIPKGSEVTGSISRIIRPGRLKGKAVMYLLFQSINIPGHGQLPIVASLVSVDSEGIGGIRSEGSVESEGSTGSDVGKVLAPGLAGAGIGTLAGGGKGAGIGAGIGAAIGLAAVFTSRGKDLDVRRGSNMEISLDRALTIPAETVDAATRNR